MKNWVRLFIFLAAFQMEVRVRAAGDLIQEPESCLRGPGACVVQSVEKPFYFSKDGVGLSAPAQATLERIENKKWRLVSGSVWVSKGQKVTVESVYAEVRSQSGEFWVIEKENKLWVRNLSADLVVRLRDGKELALPAGFEFWVAGINTQSTSEYGVLQAIELKDHIKNWAALYPGTTAQFKKDVLEFKENWKTLAAQGGTLYQEMATRRIASVEDAKLQEKLKKERLAAEKKRLREIYLERTFER